MIYPQSKELICLAQVVLPLPPPASYLGKCEVSLGKVAFTRVIEFTLGKFTKVSCHGAVAENNRKYPKQNVVWMSEGSFSFPR